MPLMADLLKEIFGTGWPQKADALMERPPMEGEKSGKVLKPEAAERGQMMARDPKAVIDDSGQQVDYDSGSTMLGFIKKLMEGKGTFRGEQGTLSGFLSRLLNPAPMGTDTGVMGKQGTVGGGVGSDHVPGTGKDPGLDPTPTAKQRQRSMAPVNPNNQDLDRAPPQNYAQPTALDPQQIEELRQSLLSDSGQRDPNNPNGLAGRMTGPYSNLDQGAGMQEAQGIADKIRGDYNSVTSRSPLDQPAQPVSLQDTLKSILLGGQ